MSGELCSDEFVYYGGEEKNSIAEEHDGLCGQVIVAKSKIVKKC